VHPPNDYVYNINYCKKIIQQQLHVCKTMNYFPSIWSSPLTADRQLKQAHGDGMFRLLKC